MHRSMIALTVLGSAVFNAAVTAGNGYESAFPYKVQVTATNASIHCGPGEGYYVTERPARGVRLSVYRHSPGGWLAVRPTAASYSLLAERYVRATAEDDVVEVIDDHAVSWVGSADERPDELRWQVRLKQGEKVVVMGQETLRAYRGGPRESHYRIAPPSGEFRWVHESSVRHASQVENAESTLPASTELTDYRVVVNEPESGARRDGFVARKPKNAAVRPVAVEVRRDETRADRLAPQEPTAAPGPRAASRSNFPPLDAAAFEKQFRALDVQLSLEVTKPVEHWELDDLADDIAELVTRGGSTVDRGRAQLLAEKTGEFEKLQARYLSTEGSLSRTDDVAEHTSMDAEPPQSPSGVDPRFDGTGYLYPVHSRNQASPPYALLNKDGTILQFVSPAPGLNLHRYLRKEIGVFGHQTAGSGLDKPHVTAERVVSLSRHRR